MTSRDLCSLPRSALVEKDGWLSLKGQQGQALVVRALLTVDSFTLYTLSAKAHALNTTNHHLPSSEANYVCTNRNLSSSSVGSLGLSGNGNAKSIKHKSIELHPKIAERNMTIKRANGAQLSEPLSNEAVAHSLLFCETKNYPAVALSSPVPEITDAMCSYIELLIIRGLKGLESSDLGTQFTLVSHRAGKYCEAVISFPSLTLHSATLSSLLRLVSSLGSLDSQLAESLKVKVAKAQKQAQRIRQRMYTPLEQYNGDSQERQTSGSPPISMSPWASKILKLAQSSHGLPPNLFLESGFVKEFAEQIAAFHRRVWKYGSPIDDFSLLFHTPQSNAHWSTNPLVFDKSAPHFLGLLAAQHALSTSLSIRTRARLIEKWIILAEFLRKLGDNVGWTGIIAMLTDSSILRLENVWSLVDPSIIKQYAEDWSYEAFELYRRYNIPFLSKNAFRINSQHVGEHYAKGNCVPYFGDSIINDGKSGDTDYAARQLARIRDDVVPGWCAFMKSVTTDVPLTHIREDPAYQCLFAVWAQQPILKFDFPALSLATKPKLLGHYLPNFYNQVLPLTIGAMLPVLFVSSSPNFRLFPRSTLLMTSQVKHPNRPRALLRRSSSFPPARPPQTTGFSELDVGAREQLENTASAHVLARVVRDLLNLGTDVIDTSSGIIFKAFTADEIDRRNSRTSSIIENLNRRSMSGGRHVVVKSANMVRLVDVLVLGAGFFGKYLTLDSDTHVATLLATYRSFCSPVEMLDMLKMRIRCARGASKALANRKSLTEFLEPENLWLVSKDDDPVDSNAINVVTNIISMLDNWISEYFFDFTDDEGVMEAGHDLLDLLRNEVTHGYPSTVSSQCLKVISLFLRYQFSISSTGNSFPSWLRLVFDPSHQDKVKHFTKLTLDIPVINLEPDEGLRAVNTMVNELDMLVKDSFSRIRMVDWMKLFEVLEQQTVSATGLFNYSSSPYSSESDIIIKDIYSWLGTLQQPNNKTKVLDVLPDSITALVRLHFGLVTYFAQKIADPNLAHAHERRERMSFMMKMLGVLRSRMLSLNLAADLDHDKDQNIPSFLEQALVSAILLPESRSYASSWLLAGKELSFAFPDSQSGLRNLSLNGTSNGNEFVPNLLNIFVPSVGFVQGKPVTPCIGWITERLLEIVCCVPNCSVDHPDHINFDKRRYAFNLVKNMCHDYQSTTPFTAPLEIVEKYSFLFGEPAQTASVPTPLLDRRTHKESVAKEGRNKQKVFVDVIARELDKMKSESRLHDKLERMHGSSLDPANSQGFYGLPLSQSSTSLYSKRVSRIVPSSSVLDVASYSDNSSGSAGSNYATLQNQPSLTSKRSVHSHRKSRLGSFFKSVRPLSVLGGSSAPSSSGSITQNTATAANQFYNHQNESGSASSLLQNEKIDSQWTAESSIVLSSKPLCSAYDDSDWQLLNKIELVSIKGIEMKGTDFLLVFQKSGSKPDSKMFKASSIEDSQDWYSRLQRLSDTCLMKSTKVFGVPLRIVAEREKRQVPAFLEILLDEIERRGLEEVGIYRISGSLAAVNSIKNWFDQGNVDVKVGDPKWSDINAIAGCIKLYLRELPEPLMTPELLPEFMAAVGSSGVSIDAFKTVIEKLPSPNYSVLKRLSKHLRLIVDHSHENKMNMQNIAIVFSVNFLPPVAMTHMAAMQQLVSTLVTQKDSLFPM